MAKAASKATRAPQQRFPLRLTEPEYQQLRHRAFKEERPMNDIMRDALHDYLMRPPPSNTSAADTDGAA